MTLKIALCLLAYMGLLVLSPMYIIERLWRLFIYGDQRAPKPYLPTVWFRFCRLLLITPEELKS